MSETRRIKIDIEVTPENLSKAFGELGRALIMYAIDHKKPAMAFMIPSQILSVAFSIFSSMADDDMGREQLYDLTIQMLKEDLERAKKTGGEMSTVIDALMKIKKEGK